MELKATTAQEIVQNEKDCDYMDELFGGVKMPPTQVYLKSEADAVIAEKDAEIAKLKEAFKNAVELSQVQKSYETATFYRMISRYEYSSGYGTNGENCIEDFASNITFCHTPNKYWKLVKGGKTIAREAIYLGE